MAFIDNFFIPLLQLLFYIVMIGWVSYLLIKLTKRISPDLEWVLKYKLLRKQFSEDDVEWCMDAIERDIGIITVKRFLLLKGKSPKRTAEILYIYKQIFKKMKGGKENGRQFEQNNGKDQQIQKI